jgi:hypothetical protein
MSLVRIRYLVHDLRRIAASESDAVGVTALVAHVAKKSRRDRLVSP